jgi:hypothetical protein
MTPPHIHIGDHVNTKHHGPGIVRAISQTVPEYTSIDIQLIHNGKLAGWVCIPISDIDQPKDDGE